MLSLVLLYVCLSYRHRKFAPFPPWSAYQYVSKVLPYNETLLGRLECIWKKTALLAILAGRHLICPALLLKPKAWSVVTWKGDKAYLCTWLETLLVRNPCVPRCVSITENRFVVVSHVRMCRIRMKTWAFRAALKILWRTFSFENEARWKCREKRCYLLNSWAIAWYHLW